MSLDPGAIQKMLAQGLSAQSQGGGQAGPAMQGSISPMNAAATLAQKAMLVNALQRQQSTANANAMLPGTQARMALDPQMQALQQSPAPLPQTFPAAGGQ